MVQVFLRQALAQIEDFVKFVVSIENAYLHPVGVVNVRRIILRLNIIDLADARFVASRVRKQFLPVCSKHTLLAFLVNT